MTLKMAVFAPMPSANVMIAMIVNDGRWPNIRNPYRKSCNQAVIVNAPHNSETETLTENFAALIVNCYATAKSTGNQGFERLAPTA